MNPALCILILVSNVVGRALEWSIERDDEADLRFFGENSDKLSVGTLAFLFLFPSFL